MILVLVLSESTVVVVLPLTRVLHGDLGQH